MQKNGELPLGLKCPNKPPTDLTFFKLDVIRTVQLGIQDVSKSDEVFGSTIGLNASQDTAFEADATDSQIQAARALVPCAEDTVSLFIPNYPILRNDTSNPHDEYSVAVIYSDAKSKQDIIHWLK